MEVKVAVKNKEQTMYFSQENISSFSITEDIGLVLPSCVISFNIRYSKDLEFFKDKNLKVFIDFVFKDKTVPFIFTTIETNIQFNMESSTVTLNCLPFYREGYLRSRIFSKDDTTVNVIKEVVKDMGIEEDKIECLDETDDKQVWIQYQKNYEFLRELITHSKLKDDEDSSLIAYTRDGFLFKSYNELIKKKESLIIKDYNFNNTSIMVGNADKDLILKPGTKVMEFKLIDGERIPQDIVNFTVDSNFEEDNNDNYIDYLVNFGNTFDDYNFMPLHNYQRWYEIENNTITLDFANIDGSLRIGDVIKLDLDSSYNGFTSILNGKYIITGLNYSLDKTFKTKIKLSKKD